MIKTIKNSILFSALLFVFCAGNIYAHPAWGIVVDSQKQVYFTDLESVWKIDGQEKKRKIKYKHSSRFL